MAFNEQKLE